MKAYGVFGFCMMYFLATVHCVCRDGWERFDDSCYLFTVDPKESWPIASAFCQASSGHLVEIDSQHENDYIKGHLQNLSLPNSITYRFWTAGEDIAKEGSWIWAHTGTAIEVFFWAPGEPNQAGEEDCLNLSNQAEWNDQECDEKWSYICEIEDYNGGAVVG